MRKIIPIMLVFAMLLSACGGDSTAKEPTAADVPQPTADELAQTVMISVGVAPEDMVFVNESHGADAMPGYVEGYYGLASEIWTECAIYRTAASDKAHEFSVFHLNEQADISSVFNCLEEYRRGRQGDFFGYNPEQADLVDKGLVSLSADGAWAALFICEDTTAADEAFYSRLGMELPDFEEPKPTENDEPVFHTELGELPEYWYPYVDPNIDDMTIWDNTEFVAAVKAGDDYYLSQEEKVLFKIVIGVLNQIIEEDMTELEKEEAVYRWLTEKVEYDYCHYEVPPCAPRESYEPMGAIASRKAVCLGFATAFQLFMDILDIECITVVGAAFESREDHAWNMVKIDGEWYCVDATWDVGAYGFGYFNKSSEWFAMTSHQWDYEAYPIAMPEKIGTME